MADAVRRLEKIIEDREVSRSKYNKASAPRVMGAKQDGAAGGASSSCPWAEGSKIATSLETLASRLKDSAAGAKLEELRKEVEPLLGAQAVATVTGVYNAARLYSFLCVNKMEVEDTKAMIVLNANARTEHKMNEKREAIIGQDLHFGTLPRAAELQR